MTCPLILRGIVRSTNYGNQKGKLSPILFMAVPFVSKSTSARKVSTIVTDVSRHRVLGIGHSSMIAQSSNYGNQMGKLSPIFLKGISSVLKSTSARKGPIPLCAFLVPAAREREM